MTSGMTIGCGLAQHRGFGLDAADAPAEHGEAVHHGGVAVGADQRVGIEGRLLAVLLLEHDLREELEVHLVADAGAWRHDAEIVERHLAPAQELVALEVAFVLELHIGAEGGVVAEIVDDDGVVDDEIDRDQRIDLLGVAAQLAHGVAHGGEVDHGGHAGEVLHQDARRPEVDLLGGFAAVLHPVGEGRDVGLLDGRAVFVANQVFHQDAQRKWQAGEIADLLLDRREAEIGVGLATDLQRFAGLEAVGVGGCHRRYSCERYCGRGGKIGAPDDTGNRRMQAAMRCARLSVCKAIFGDFSLLLRSS